MKRKEPMKRTAFKRKPFGEALAEALDKFPVKGPRIPLMNRKPGELDDILRAYHGFKPRKKPMGPGKVKLTRKRLMKAAIDGYFKEHGWEDGTKAFDQVTGLVLDRMDAIGHHKTPESELRKAGLSVEERNQPKRLVVCHWAVHKAWIHRDCPGGMGRPQLPNPFATPTNAFRNFSTIEYSLAHAGNNLCVPWSDQDRDDLFLFLGVNTNA